MTHDPGYFKTEVEKLKALALNRGWKSPPPSDATLIFRSDDNPQDVSVDGWAACLHAIEDRHGVPLDVVGGGYGCFAVAAASDPKRAGVLFEKIEKDVGLQQELNRIGGKFIELWRRRGTSSDLELIAPSYRYQTVVATNRSTETPLRAGQETALEVFGTSDGELVVGMIDLWVYDPRSTAKRPSILKRIWRRWRGNLQSLEQQRISSSALRVVPLEKLGGALSPPSEATPGPQFTVFVHGYATSLKDAVDSFGRVIHNVRYDQINAVPVLFSWPSQRSARRYLSDTPLAARSEKTLHRLLGGLCPQERGRATVDLFAHSHGTHLALRSLTTLQTAAPAKDEIIRNLIFVAPDIDYGLFDEYVDDLLARSKRVTVYYSEGDLALWTSERVQSQRMGRRPGKNASGVDRIDLIDASLLGGDWLGHSYHVGSPEMHEDIRALIEGQPAHKRRLLQKSGPDGLTWRIQPVR